MDILAWLDKTVEPESADVVLDKKDLPSLLKPYNPARQSMLSEPGLVRKPIALDSSIIEPLHQQATKAEKTDQTGSIGDASRVRSLSAVELTPSTGNVSDNQYKRKPRRVTKANKYEAKADKHRLYNSRRTISKDDKEGKGKAKKRRREKSGMKSNTYGFRADNVHRERLTVRATEHHRYSLEILTIAS
jgi:hypothetical protein